MAGTERTTRGRVVLAAIYCRISDDREGEALGVKRQEADCRRLAEQRGWDVSPNHVYVDNDRGASTLSRKKRPAYEKMIAAIEAGHVNGLVYYSNSRLTRRPMEWLQLIQMVNTHRLKMASCVSGTHDLTTADGRAVALTIAAWDAAEAERIGERQQRKQKELRERGRPHGGRRVFGYLDAIDGERAYLSEIDPREAEAIRRASQHILAGGSCWEVMKIWNAEGIRTPTGKEWRDPGTVKRVLLNPTLSGNLVHQGEIIGTGDWPAVLDRSVQLAMAAMLDRAPKRRRVSKRHILSGLVFCQCGAAMLAQVSEPHHNRYACMAHRGGCGKVTRSKPWLEERVTEALAYLLEQNEPRDARQTDETSRRIEELQAAIGHLEGLIADTTRRMTDGEVAPEDGWPSVAEWRSRINTARGELGKLAVTQAKAEVGTRMSAVEALALYENPKTDYELRRQILESQISRIIVMPLGRGGGWGANREIPADSIQILPA